MHNTTVQSWQPEWSAHSSARKYQKLISPGNNLHPEVQLRNTLTIINTLKLGNNLHPEVKLHNTLTINTLHQNVYCEDEKEEEEAGVA